MIKDLSMDGMDIVSCGKLSKRVPSCAKKYIARLIGLGNKPKEIFAHFGISRTKESKNLFLVISCLVRMGPLMV